MKFDMNNPLWETDPKKAKEGFEKELREKYSKFLDGSLSSSWIRVTIEEILG